MPEASNDLLSNVLHDICRGKSESLDVYLKTITEESIIEDTITTFYAHTLVSDGNGNIRLDDFIQFLVHHVVAYAIPRSRLIEAQQKDNQEGLGVHMNGLYTEAKKLFIPTKTTGEGGEMLLFIFGEILLRLPQLLCKMSMKTSGKMHYHGADGIHVGLSDTGTLELYWGESKMHSSFDESARECLKDLAPYLKREADHEDLLLLKSHLDLYNPAYTQALKKILNKDNKEFNDVTYCGLCFIGFDQDLYSKSTTEEAINLSYMQWREALKTKLQNRELTEFKIHFFCLPFLSIQEFRNTFLKKLGLSNE